MILEVKRIKSRHYLWHYILTIFFIFARESLFIVGWFLVALAGYFVLTSRNTPYDLILGIPLFLGGGALWLNAMVNPLLSIFSPIYNKGMCRLCNSR